MKPGIMFFLFFLSTTAFCQFVVVGSPEKLAGGDGNIFQNPRWSPDGQSIAFSGANYKGLWIFDINSQQINMLTEENAAGFGYEWSKDSRSILTRVAKFEELKRYNAVKLFDVDTKNSTMISGYNSFMPDVPKWNSDDSKIYFYNNDGLEVHNSGKKTMNKSASGIKEIFLKNDKLVTGDINKQEFSPLDPLKAEHYLNLRISPDQSKVVFEVYGGNLYSMNVDGTNVTDLGKGFRASWSPDSRYVVYMITEDDGHQYTSSDLFITSFDGSVKQQLTFTNEKLEMDPDWSPDGTKIVYDENNEGAVYSITVIKK